REKILKYYQDDQDVFSVHLVSFGFKYGIPIDADLVFDVRFLPNPHYVPQMQPLTGLNPEVSSYVFKWTETQRFIEKLNDLLQFTLPQYKKEGRTQLVVAIGCTGGQHRSVALTEHFDKLLGKQYMTQQHIVILRNERKRHDEPKEPKCCCYWRRNRDAGYFKRFKGITDSFDDARNRCR